MQPGLPDPGVPLPSHHRAQASPWRAASDLTKLVASHYNFTMPIFEYRCNSCGTVSEFLTGVTQDQPEIACDNCGGTKLERLMSAANFTIKGGSRSRAMESVPPCGAGPNETCDHCRHAQ